MPRNIPKFIESEELQMHVSDIAQWLRCQHCGTWPTVNAVQVHLPERFQHLSEKAVGNHLRRLKRTLAAVEKAEPRGTVSRR